MAGPSSGIQIDDDVVQEFNEIIKGHRDKYCLLKISSDQKHVQVDEIGAKEKTYEDCRQKLIAGGPRYAIVDFDLEESRQGVGVAKTSKVVLMKWTPDGCPVRERMLYTSTFNTLKAKLGGALVHCECHDESELEEVNIEARCRKSK